MVTTPEEYLIAQDFTPVPESSSYTPAERLFMKKYLGVQAEELSGPLTEEDLKRLAVGTLQQNSDESEESTKKSVTGAQTSSSSNSPLDSLSSELESIAVYETAEDEPKIAPESLINSVLLESINDVSTTEEVVTVEYKQESAENDPNVEQTTEVDAETEAAPASSVELARTEGSEENEESEEAEETVIATDSAEEISSTDEENEENEEFDEDLAVFDSTLEQQKQSIAEAITALESDGTQKEYMDALFRSLSTIQNSCNYMGFEEAKNYAAITGGLVDQGRKTGLDFALMTDMLSQETAILYELIDKALISAKPSDVAINAEGADLSASQKLEEPAPQQTTQAATQENIEESASTKAAEESQEKAASAAEREESVASETSDVTDDATRAAAETATQVAVEEENFVDEYEEGLEQEPPIEVLLKEEDFCQLVGFYLGEQEFVVPTMVMQEVIRYEPPVRLPMAPPFVAGVITLRGKVTPVLNLKDILEVKSADIKNNCIIICIRQGLQIGLIVESIRTMYRVPQKDLDFNIESQLGINVDTDFISGIMKSEDGSRLLAIVSVDRIITNMLS